MGLGRVRVRLRFGEVHARRPTANPPQGNDAKCGFACHTIVKNRDYVFTDYAHR